MTVTVSQGLNRARELYQNRTLRVKQLKADGKQVIGYLDIYPVLEMLTAFDLVPYGMLGDMEEPITKADICLPTVVCPFLRSVMDMGLKGRFDFLDGIVMAHGCEVSEKMAHIWRMYLNPPYAHFIDTPHTTHAAALKHFKELLKDFEKTLESFTGREITGEKLKEAIKLHNQQRMLMCELYDLRKPDPPLISGAEMVQIQVALLSLPVSEGSELLRQVISEVRQRQNGPARKPARLLVWGSIIDDTTLIDMIESMDANVVMDDTIISSRAYFSLVELTEDPLDGLAYRYLVGLKTPRTFRQAPLKNNKKDYKADLEARFGYLAEYARNWNVNGVILQVMRYCDIYSYEIPALKDYLDSIGLPSIYLEIDYNRRALAHLRTRVQAFLEIIG